MKLAVFTVGYNRIEGMLRLINSLKEVDFFGSRVDFIISLDKSNIEEQLVSAVSPIEWPFGEKKIRTFPERQGLRKHILSCGDFLSDYDAIAVLEDDLLVSPSFYSYIRACYAKYSENENIAGVSLYKHLYNVNSSQPFEPEQTQYDVYFMQFAMSWGQLWFRKQWFAFKDWYEKNNAEFGLTDGIPDCVCKWSNSSWLKYHIRYCIETNKFFVYPYQSITTCFSEEGEHAKTKLTTFQVPILSDIKKEYLLPDYEKAVKYDAFFERIIENVSIGAISSKELFFDIYVQKHKFEGKRYIISTQDLPYKVIDSFALDMRPHEINVLRCIKGSNIFFYDSMISCNAPKRNREALFRYYYRLDGNPYEVLYSAATRVKEKLFKTIKRK